MENDSRPQTEPTKGDAIAAAYRVILDEFPYGMFTREEVIAKLAASQQRHDAHEMDYAFQRLLFEKRIVPVEGGGKYILNKENINHESGA